MSEDTAPRPRPPRTTGAAQVARPRPQPLGGATGSSSTSSGLWALWVVALRGILGWGVLGDMMDEEALRLGILYNFNPMTQWSTEQGLGG